MESIVINNVNDIDTFVLEYIIKNDDPEQFYDYINFYKIKINKDVINTLIKHESNKISSQLAIELKDTDVHLLYYLIFMSEDIDLTNKINFTLDIEISMNYLKDILINGKVRSFYYLYDTDQTIINSLFEEDKNILHLIKQNGNYSDLVEMIINLKPDLLNLKDSNKETPIMFHSKSNPEIVKIMLGYEFDYTLTDSHGNTFIHYLCKSDNPDILKYALKRCPELIDMPNKKSETPITITGLNDKEDMFYVLKSMGADIKTKDLYGNTVFHYLCANSMCLGMIIDNSPNYFGLRPSDYCKISPKYYTFV